MMEKIIWKQMVQYISWQQVDDEEDDLQMENIAAGSK